MVEIAVLIPVAGIVATAWVIVTALRLRHERRVAEGSDKAAHAQDKAGLEQENKTLRLSVERLEDRMRVLESIATDPAERTAREIERLR